MIQLNLVETIPTFTHKRVSMARRRSSTLTEAELRLMEVLWQRGESTVAEVTAALPPPPLAYNSVLTTMRILERKGYVAHEEAGPRLRLSPARRARRGGRPRRRTSSFTLL